jgi:ASC-1-like (ASCH) protein
MYILMGFKIYELRKCSKFIDSLKENDVIYINHRGFIIKCKIIEINDFCSVRDVFHSGINHTSVVPDCDTIDDAIMKYNNYYDNCYTHFKTLKLDINV